MLLEIERLDSLTFQNHRVLTVKKNNNRNKSSKKIGKLWRKKSNKWKNRRTDRE